LLLNAIASRAYGPDWKERGRSHLGEAAALLLALLWPSGASPAVQGATAERINLSRKPQPSAESRHLRHLRHLLHLRHRRRWKFSPVKAAIATAAAIVVVSAGTALAVGFSGSNASDQHHRTVHTCLHPSLPPSSPAA
jgi:hypothetical protein